MKKNLIYILTFITSVFLFSCKKNTEIIHTLTHFYGSYKGDHKKADKESLSEELKVLIQKTEFKEINEIHKTQNSLYSDEKPLMIEGDIFTSMYEGMTEMNVSDINIEGSTAKVLVEFENKKFKQKWKDIVVLKKENGWKIDDVIYENNGGTLKSYLKEFLLYKN